MIDEIFFNIASGFFHLVDVVAIDAVIKQSQHTLSDYMVALSRFFLALVTAT